MITPIIKNHPTGRRNIPRYLYHLTTKENYNSMLKDGFVRTSHDTDESSNLNGVFLFDMINFVKRWNSTGLLVDFLEKPLSLMNALILNATIKNPEILLLKIPTKNLLLGKLKCRVQNLPPKISLDHEKNGDFAINQKFYTRKKCALEYIYENNIPISDIIKIGTINTNLKLNDRNSFINYTKNMNGLEIMSKLLKNNPEQKCIDLAKNSSFKIILFDD